MPSEFSQLAPRFIEFIEAQSVFFVASAAADGRVNVSPKGLDTLRVVSPERIVWLNLTGSGNETAAHVQKVNRITLMFCAFEGPALILRVYGTCVALHPRDNGWDACAALFPEYAGARTIFDVRINSVQTSCGTGVPLMGEVQSRGEAELLPFYEAMSDDELEAYWRKKNVRSIDGLETGLFDERASRT
ncbi:MAG: pyridoxamine 5'-phosphate oxidase family protein [Pseudomonadota bacterium]